MKIISFSFRLMCVVCAGSHLKFYACHREKKMFMRFYPPHKIKQLQSIHRALVHQRHTSTYNGISQQKCIYTIQIYAVVVVVVNCEVCWHAAWCETYRITFPLTPNFCCERDESSYFRERAFAYKTHMCMQFEMQ